MNLTTINNLIDRIRGRTLTFFSAGNQWRRRIALFLAVIGPGIITSNVDNDAGGIATYTQAGSAYGYTLLWSLGAMTIWLYVTMGMVARVGVRADGCDHGEGTFGSDPRGVRVSVDVFRDDYRIFGGFGERGGGVCGGGGGCADFWGKQVYCGASGGGGGVGAGVKRNVPAGGSCVPDRVHF